MGMTRMQLWNWVKVVKMRRMLDKKREGCRHRYRVCQVDNAWTRLRAICRAALWQYFNTYLLISLHSLVPPFGNRGMELELLTQAFKTGIDWWDVDRGGK